MTVAIVKYNAGNIQSVRIALERLGANYVLSDDVEVLKNADKVIFPGVGEASSAMQFLKQKNLDQTIKALKQPVLGICLGLQLLCRHSEENNTQCMSVFDIEVKKFDALSGEKVPQIGWNNIYNFKSPLFKDIKEQEFVYFVHSFYAQQSPFAICQTDYAGETFSAGLQRDNFYALQFHPEKSGLIGAKILRNFLEIKG